VGRDRVPGLLRRGVGDDVAPAPEEVRGQSRGSQFPDIFHLVEFVRFPVPHDQNEGVAGGKG
jgi:hypothetical protein